jgi:predicted nuclease of predicted toxin-antitoxin system
MRAFALLRQRKLDCVHVEELRRRGSVDESLVELASQSGRTIVTLDSDFHRILAHSNATSPSVIRLRMEKLREREAADVIFAPVFRYREALEKGAAVSASRLESRMRPLPIR